MSTKTIADKLLIKQDTSIWLSHAEHLARIEPLPAGARVVDELGEATVALVFANAAAAAREILTARSAQLAQLAIFWVAYPKGNKADINRDTLWPILAEYGMRPIAQVAIDPVWSALRFRPLKEGEAPFMGGQ
jgi:hypothetical protein